MGRETEIKSSPLNLSDPAVDFLSDNTPSDKLDGWKDNEILILFPHLHVIGNFVLWESELLFIGQIFVRNSYYNYFLKNSVNWTSVSQDRLAAACQGSFFSKNRFIKKKNTIDKINFLFLMNFSIKLIEQMNLVIICSKTS